ncbi:MAG TPA: amylo-alpha-1,6-glucosidase [Kofleriaceae bacterium]|jgi:predicted glycogen debranching enzyme|nr:amylo-alpha-1,6-glucosidase [Kofleriaceae bacterium]
MTEWLEADGLGGFAMGTADGIRTRRYHAVLLAASHPPEGRRVLVADLEVFVETAAGRFALTSHRYGARGEVVYPDGAERLVGFSDQPWPRWEWALPDGTRIVHELVVEHVAEHVVEHVTRPAPAVGPELRAPRVALRWTRLAGTATSLHVQPLLAGRDYHATHHENPAFRFDPELAGDRVTWQPYPDVPAIHCTANGLYQHAPDWYRNFYYADEAERGLDAVEDLATPGVFTFDLASGAATMVLSTGALPAEAGDAAAQSFAAEARRRAAYGSPIARAAGAYIVARGAANGASGGRTIIAGYPWFSDWGRDTFISLRGLCLATGRRADARAILCQWAGAVSAGMLPNRFGEHDATPEYNSVDAALWFVIAADAYLAAPAAGPEPATAADRELLRGAITAIVEGYRAGTRHRIHADADGLLACGEPGIQLTWMDAKVDGECVTPRIGKPVEIQALWFNALTIAGRAADAARVQDAFGRFWDPQRGQLHDVIDADHVPGALDPTCRPNQIFAVGGLPHPILDPGCAPARAVVELVERQLWTPAGLRSLAPGDPRYHPRYVGGPSERDHGYHNGTVWPWLAGPFIEAWVRVHGATDDARREARTRFLAPLLARCSIAGLDHLSEICDGDAPHRPVGCPFQAWSLAEALRISQLLG